jgi:hypothetical protein
MFQIDKAEHGTADRNVSESKKKKDKNARYCIGEDNNPDSKGEDRNIVIVWDKYEGRIVYRQWTIHHRIDNAIRDLKKLFRPNITKNNLDSRML